MANAHDIWNIDTDRQQIWDADPNRAAMLAYLEVVSLWHEQVEAGTYWGIPAMHRLARPENEQTRELLAFEPRTSHSRPSRYTRDESAGQYVVPNEVWERWRRAA